jgi:hypothetical protein
MRKFFKSFLYSLLVLNTFATLGFADSSLETQQIVRTKEDLKVIYKEWKESTQGIQLDGNALKYFLLQSQNSAIKSPNPTNPLPQECLKLLDSGSAIVLSFNNVKYPEKAFLLIQLNPGSMTLSKKNSHIFSLGSDGEVMEWGKLYE